MNASNQENLAKVADELQKVEERIEVEKAALLEWIIAFQEYLAKQEAAEKEEVTWLNVEQNKLDACEQQVLNAVEELDGEEEENEWTRQNLSDNLAKSSVQGQESLTKSPVPSNLTSEQLRAKLDRMRSQRELDR